MRCLIYARVSSDVQKEKQTIASQLDELPEYAKRRGWTIVDIEKDDGISGETIAARPGFQAVLKAIESGGVDILLVIDIDRLSRSTSDQERARISDLLRTKNCLLATPMAEFNLRIPEHDFLINNLSSVSKLFKMQFKEKTSRGKRAAFKEGGRKPGGRLPYGYRWIPTHVGGKRNIGYFDICEDEAKIVREAYRLAQSMGLAYVTERLNRDGFRTRKGGLWTHRVVRVLLRNSAVKGEFKCKVGEDRFTMALPQIISDDLWDAVQSALDRRRCDPLPDAKKQPQLLSGFLRCGICGETMSVQRVESRTYYRCRTSGEWRAMGLEGSCGNRCHRAEPLDAAVWAKVREVLTAPENIRQYNARHKKAGTNKGAATVESLEKRLAQLERHRKKVLEQSRLGQMEGDEFDREMTATKRDRARLEADLQQLKRKPAETVADRKQLLEHLNSKALEDRRRVIRGVIGHSAYIKVPRTGEVKMPSEAFPTSRKALARTG